MHSDITPYDKTCRMWPCNDESFFRDRKLKVFKQAPKQCVATVLSILTGIPPDELRPKIITQDPVSWSEAIRVANMKLAYCPTDTRKREFYMEELIGYDDLFTLCYYTPKDPSEILGKPKPDGWLTDSHIVILHRDKVLDSATGQEEDARRHKCNHRHTKRVFPVVPPNHPRGLCGSCERW